MSTETLPGPAQSATEQVRRWVEEPVAFWEECASRHGSLVALNLGSLGPVVLVSDPECVRGIFQLPRDSFECHSYNEHYRFVMGERSVLVHDGEEHRRQKPLISAPLRREALVPEVGTVHSLALRMAAAWPSGEPFDPRPGFHDYTFQIVAHLIFGDLDNATARALVAAYRASVVPQIGASWSPWQRFRRLHEEIRRQLAPEITARRQEPELPGILTQLATAGRNGEAPPDDGQIGDHVFTLMVAGVDTTAIALTWALHWLARTPPARERLLAELDAVSGAPPEALLALPYLQAVFLETLRMYPVVPTPSGRKLLRDVEIGGRHFSAGVTLVPCSYLVHRREELYPGGGEFRPERFLDRRPESHHYFPFGGGVRTCIGEQLAQLDFKQGLNAVLTRWNVESLAKGPVTAVRHGTMLAPSAEFRILVQPREESL